MGEVNGDETEKLVLVPVVENVVKVEVDTVIVDDEIEGLEEEDWEGLVTEVLVMILELINVVGKLVDENIFVSVERG